MAGDVQICAKCENNMKNKDEIINCDSCKNLYHNSCVGITNTAYTQLKKIKGTLWFCENCGLEKELVKTVAHKLVMIEKLLSEHSEKLKRLESKPMNSFLSCDNSTPTLSQQTPLNRNKRTYAAVFNSASIGNNFGDSAKKMRSERSVKDTPNRNFHKMKNAVIVKPNESYGADAPVKNAVKASLNRETDRVCGIKETKNGNIVIECENAEASKAVRTKLLSKLQNCDVNHSSDKFWPRFTIVNVEKYMDEDSFIDNLKKENSSIPAKAVIKVVKEKVNKAGKRIIIIECDLQTGDIIRQKREVVIDWEICPTFEYVGITRCYHCFNYGHIAADCNGTKACSKCGETHDSKECKAASFTCINCIRFNSHLPREEYSLRLNVHHPVFSTSCPIYKQKAQKKLGRMKYNE